MFCDEALNAVEAVAAGELVPDRRLADHYATCPDCATALTRARDLDRMLRDRSVPKAPAHFTARTMASVRRQRWRSEQVVDAGFNVGIAVVVLSILIGVWMLFSRTGLAAVGNDAVEILGSGLSALATMITPSLPVYLAATALFATALGIWWWAERGTA